VVEVIFEQAVEQAAANPEHYTGIDIGMHILAALASNKPNFQSVILNGRPLKKHQESDISIWSLWLSPRGTM